MRRRSASARGAVLTRSFRRGAVLARSFRRGAVLARSFRRRAVLALVAALAAGSVSACLDFVEPEIPHAGAPATLNVSLLVFNERTAALTARLEAGFDGVGLPRRVLDETLRLSGQSLQPVQRLEDGALLYETTRAVTPAEVLGPITVVPPSVTGTTPPPAPTWLGMRRVGPDTLDLVAGTDLVLELEVAAGGTAVIRQWFLELVGIEGSAVRLSADGPPPERLVVPAIWVPAPAGDGAVNARLTYIQTETTAGPFGDYVVSASLQIRLSWVVRVPGEAPFAQVGRRPFRSGAARAPR
jgi:hypothetical protein